MTQDNYLSFADAMDSGHTVKSRAGLIVQAGHRMQELYQTGLSGRSPQERYEALKEIEKIREKLERDGVISNKIDLSTFGINPNQYNRAFTQSCADYFLHITQAMDINSDGLKNPMALQQVSADLDRMNRYFMGRGENVVSQDIVTQAQQQLKPATAEPKSAVSLTSQV